jgi:hypothetical protein
MPDPLSAALMAGAVTLSAAYINSFVAESYRRHRDGSALAAGILGELASYEAAWPMLKTMLLGIISAIDDGKREGISFRTIERPKDRFFDEAVGKLGALGSDFVEEIVYVYGNIGGFRLGLEVISKEFDNIGDAELRHRCVTCIAAIDRAGERSSTLLPLLRKRATEKFLF